MRYLGVIIDCSLLFNQHYKFLAQKCGQLLPKLMAVCQNTCGFSNSARKAMIKATIVARYKYCCTAFAHRAAYNRKTIEEIDKKMAQYCSHLYCTTGYYTATAISHFLPLELELSQRALRVCYLKGWKFPDVGITPPNRATNKEELLQELLLRCTEKWQELYNKRGCSCTKELLPSVTDTTGAEVDFFLGQALSGHGCFRAYLVRIKKLDSATCPCGSGDKETPSHVFQSCVRFSDGRPKKLMVGDPVTCAYMSSAVRKL